MGNTRSYITGENTNRNYTSVNKFDSPSPSKRRSAHDGTLVLKDDPRSPTIAIPRTPIEIKQNEGDVATPVLKYSKSSFSYEDKNVENCKPQEEEIEEDSAFLKSGDAEKSEKPKNRSRIPLRDSSTPALLLQYRQAKKAKRAIDEYEAMQTQSSQEYSVRKRK